MIGQTITHYKIVQRIGGPASTVTFFLVVVVLAASIQNRAIAQIGDAFWSKKISDTAGNFLGGLTHALPSLHELANMAGVELPEFLGRLRESNALSGGAPGATVSFSVPSQPENAEAEE